MMIKCYSMIWIVLDKRISSPEKDLLHKERIRLILESLMLLTDKSPEDAHLVKMYLDIRLAEEEGKQAKNETVEVLAGLQRAIDKNKKFHLWVNRVI
jgi:hypothetical protein